MLKKMRLLLLVGITAVLAACGGGGDSGNAATGGGTASFAGNYMLSTFNLTEDTCSVADAKIDGGLFAVSQNGSNVFAEEFKGTVDSDNGGFTLTETTVEDGVTLIFTMKLRQTASGAATYTVNLNGKGTLGIASCSINYSGTATKI